MSNCSAMEWPSTIRLLATNTLNFLNLYLRLFLKIPAENHCPTRDRQGLKGKREKWRWGNIMKSVGRPIHNAGQLDERAFPLPHHLIFSVYNPSSLLEDNNLTVPVCGKVPIVWKSP